MKIVKVLLRNGAEWKISDGNNLFPEDYAGLNGENKLQEFKRLCEEEELTRGEEEELRWAGKLVEELDLERKAENKGLELGEIHEVQKEVEESKKLEDEELRYRWTPSPQQPPQEWKWAGGFSESEGGGDLDRPKKHEVQKEFEKEKKTGGEELCKRHRKWFPSSPN